MAIPTAFPVKYKCGHTEKRDMSNIAPSKRKTLAESDFFATKAGKEDSGMVCKKCFNESCELDKDAFLRQLMLDTEEFENHHELPELIGTEKQQSSGLVVSARKDRYTVLNELQQSDDATERLDETLEAAKALTWAGWWTNHLGYKERRENDYGPDEYIELIIDGASEEAKKQPSERIEPENPHDWDPSAELNV